MQIVTVIRIHNCINLLILYSGIDTDYDSFRSEVMTYCMKHKGIMVNTMHFKPVEMQPKVWNVFSGMRMHQRCKQLQYRQKDNGKFAQCCKHADNAMLLESN